MGKALTDNPRGTYRNLGQFEEAGAFPADGETPAKLLKGDGTESPISMTETKLFVGGVEVALYTPLSYAPLNEDQPGVTITGTLTTDGSTPITTPIFIPEVGADNYEDVTAGYYLSSTGDPGIDPWTLDLNTSTWTSGSNETVEEAVFAPDGANTGTPAAVLTTRPKTTGQFAKFNGRFFKNLGDDTTPDWRIIPLDATGEKTTPIDADETVIFDSADSAAPKKLTFANLWAWIKAKMDAGLTVAGGWAFSSTTRPTSSGTGTPASNSLITRADGDTRYGGPIYDLDGSGSHSETTTTTPIKTVVLPVGTYLIECARLTATHTDATSRTVVCTYNFSGGTASIQDRFMIFMGNQAAPGGALNFANSGTSLSHSGSIGNGSPNFGSGSIHIGGRIVVTAQTTLQIFGHVSVTPTNPVAYETSGILRKIA